ncbi:MAG: hypothetical protein ACREAU_00265 [Nitrosopumilaceae archaeon]
MAVVQYRCDTCKRFIELQQSSKSMEIINRCVITHGCRGRLYQTRVFQDFIRGKPLVDEIGIDNWLQRRILFDFIQRIESTSWIIVHDLGSIPSVQVLVDTPTLEEPNLTTEIIPNNIIHVDEDNTILEFDRPRSGTAQLIARTSDPDLLNAGIQILNVATENVQLSSNGELSIATKIETIGTNPTVALVLQYQTPLGGIFDIIYTADDQPALDSPWRDFNRVIISGKTYTVRSFDGIVGEIVRGLIITGSTVKVTQIDPLGGNIFRSIVPGEVLFLLSKPPFSVFDKKLDQFIDTFSTATSPLTYAEGGFFASPKSLRTIYPLIRSV